MFFIVYMCNIAVVIVFLEFSVDMICLGIGLYGLYLFVYIKELDFVKFMFVFSLKVCIVYVKVMVIEFWIVSYGVIYIVELGEIIVIILIGYVDGYLCVFFNCGFIFYCGRWVLVVGRVMMDMIMVSLGESEGK